MKKQLFFIALLLFSLQGLSQFSVFSEYFPYNQKTDVYPVTSNIENGLPMIFVSGNEIKILYFNEKSEFQKEILIKRSVKNTRLYLGSYIVDSSLIITFSNKKLNLISQIVVSLNNGEYKELPLLFVDHTKKCLTSWEIKDSLIVASIKENSSIIVIQKFYGQGISNEQVFDLDSVLNRTNLINNFSSLYELFDSQEGKLQKIDTSIPVSLPIASSKNKVYLQGDEIIITLDNISGATNLFALNILNNTHKLEIYPYQDSNLDGIAGLGNSFIYERTLFQIQISESEFIFNVRGLVDLKKTAIFQFSKGDNINFSNSGMYERNEKEGFMFGNPVTRVIRTSRKFLKVASKMKPAISVFNKTSNFQILMGGVMGIYQATGVMASTKLSSGGEMIVSTSGNLVIPDPVFNIPTNYSFSSYSSILTAYFSSVIDSSSFVHKNNPISKYTYDYIVEYANYMPGRYGLVTIFRMKSDYYLGYYSYANSTYNIEWFKNIDDFLVQYKLK